MPDYTTMTATPNDVVEPYTFIGKAQTKESGKIKNMGSTSITLDCGESYNIQEGYYNGSGVVIANPLAPQTSGTITAEKMISGKTAWVNGVLITGSTHSETATVENPKYVSSVTYVDGYLKSQIPVAVYQDTSNCMYISNTAMWDALQLQISKFSPKTTICTHKGTFAGDSEIPANKIRYGKIGYNKTGKVVGTLVIHTLY